VHAEQDVTHANSELDSIHWPCAEHSVDSEQGHPVIPSEFQCQLKTYR